MPESRLRRKRAYTPPSDGRPAAVKIGSPVWIAPLMVTLFLLGLLWLVVFYIAGSSIPFMASLGNLWNVVIGFVLIGAGFIVSTRWK